MLRNRSRSSLVALGILIGGGHADGVQPATQRFAIEVVDDQTNRGVPLVEFTTTAGVAYMTDSAGLVAFDDPALINQRVYFSVKSHGYEFRKDGFGFPGVALDVKPGGSAQIKVKRLNIAERLYRVTGEGIYRDSVLLGRMPPIEQPLLNAKVSGCDSVMNAIYRGRLYWFWGDTSRPAYPLGNFHITGAVSALPADGRLSPGSGVDLKIFAGDDGFARPMAQMPGEGPTWIGVVTVLPDSAGRERMLCHYVKIKPPLTAYRRGLAEWNGEAERFELVKELSDGDRALPHGHVLLVGEGDERYAYFCSPMPLMRVRATAEAYLDPEQYEAFTCLTPGSSVEEPQIDRDDAGRPRFTWRRGAPALAPGEQAKLVGRGVMKADEAAFLLHDAASGKQVLPHAGSIYWNDYRQRYVMITCELFGSSPLGEIWYAEARSPTGPWGKAVKIATHDKYSFYNPKQHPYFDQDGGRIIYFEGTYTHTFSGNEHKTPRYDYNQIMYRLDLADERIRTAASK